MKWRESVVLIQMNATNWFCGMFSFFRGLLPAVIALLSSLEMETLINFTQKVAILSRLIGTWKHKSSKIWIFVSML